jgi:hypothetical protein
MRSTQSRLLPSVVSAFSQELISLLDAKCPIKAIRFMDLRIKGIRLNNGLESPDVFVRLVVDIDD